MINEVFKAAVQYGDHKGTAAADDHDRDTLETLFRARGLIAEGDRIVGVKMYSGEVHAKRQEHPIYVTAYILSSEGFHQAQQELERLKPIPVRAVRAEMDLADFFGLYKRFEVAISRHAELNGREIQVLD
ncbi:hypothetical protein VA602_12015 [Pseudomonas sp. MH2]|uniref:Uncharacterized protein n=1 Tax=Pseudomonas machongensis TaxID=3110229 RepID=A0ABU5VFB5_9PSED|nr:hypothetical protein [Pseudomonas sp. MH2]MEA5672064.1 hypothetical protein [Pseudomonas sp. MH2]